MAEVTQACGHQGCERNAEWRPTIVVDTTVHGTKIRVKINRWFCSEHKEECDPRKLITKELYEKLAGRLAADLAMPLPPLATAIVEYSRRQDIKPTAIPPKRI